MKVFDASAALALLFNEPGADKAQKLIEDGDAVISSVNLAEVTARLRERGLTEAEANTFLGGINNSIWSEKKITPILSLF